MDPVSVPTLVLPDGRVFKFSMAAQFMDPPPPLLYQPENYPDYWVLKEES